MNFIMNIISNPWFIGIATGLIISFGTDFFKRMKEKREYYGRVKLVSKEVLDTLKSLIVEKTLPKPSMLISLHKATARNHNIKEEDMEDITIVLESLIKEIIDSNFLTYDDKIEYCQNVEEAIDGISKEYKMEERINLYDEKMNRIYKEKAKIYEQRRIVNLIAILVMTTTIALFANLLGNANLKLLSSATLSEIFSIGLMVTSLFMILFGLLLSLFRIMNRRNKAED